MVISEGLRQSLRAIDLEFAETKNELDRTKTILEKAEQDQLWNELLLAETNSKLRESEKELMEAKAKLHQTNVKLSETQNELFETNRRLSETQIEMDTQLRTIKQDFMQLESNINRKKS